MSDVVKTEIELTNKEIDVQEVNGRTILVYNKSKLKGKTTPAEVMNVALVAAKMQIEIYIRKMGRGIPLETAEVKALAELANITKIAPPTVVQAEAVKQEEAQDIDVIKNSLYSALSNKFLSDKKD